MTWSSLQQPLQKISILEKLKRELPLKSKFDQHLRISTDSWKEWQKTIKPRTYICQKFHVWKEKLHKPTYRSNYRILEQKKLMILNRWSDFINPKFFINHPYGISTSMRAPEQENPKTNGMILQWLMPHILTLKKLESHLMKSKQEVSMEFWVVRTMNSLKKTRLFSFPPLIFIILLICQLSYSYLDILNFSLITSWM